MATLRKFKAVSTIIFILLLISTVCFLFDWHWDIKNSFWSSPTEPARDKEAERKAVLEKFHLSTYDPLLPANFTPVGWFKHRQGYRSAMSNFVIKRFKGMRNGFFVECGAFDGFWLSNTMPLERNYNWTGLLIEADRGIFPRLKARNRRAWVTDVCLSPKPYPMKVNMTGAKDPQALAYIPNKFIQSYRTDKRLFSRTFEVQCYPLSMLLDALGRDVVDHFSLDVEGLELDIIKTIPLDRIVIKLINVEVRGSARKVLRNYLESVGYRWVTFIQYTSDFIHDDVYEREETEGAREKRRRVFGDPERTTKSENHVSK